jgi:hypothetical protein
MVYEIVRVLENRVRSREKLDEVTDSVADTDRDDSKHEKGNQ